MIIFQIKPYLLLSLILVVFTSCQKDEVEPTPDPVEAIFISSYEQALEDVLRSIPEEYINKARNDFHVAYQHTSHGTHVSYGVFGLQDFKDGDNILFGVTNNNPTGNKLDFRDFALEDYAPPGIDGTDLSRDETAFIQTTRNYLDDAVNAEINVVMWSWCNIKNHDVSGNYLVGMDSLIREYGVGGTKIGNGQGQRINPVHFIFMTGHANANKNVGDGRPKDQADLIIDYCRNNNLYCLDYYGIDTHCMANHYWEDAGDNGDSEEYGGNFYQDWQDNNSLGQGYYENKEAPGGTVMYGAHNTQHITANRKAYAFWWILARLAGWEGN
jgi:hypothetical protein